VYEEAAQKYTSMTVTDQTKIGVGPVPSLHDVNLLTVTGTAKSSDGSNQPLGTKLDVHSQAASDLANRGTSWLPDLRVPELLAYAETRAPDRPRAAERTAGAAERRAESAPEEALAKFDLKTAKEIALDKDGHVITDDTGRPKTSDLPAEGLSAGRHLVQMSDGRQFMITLPEGFTKGNYYPDGQQRPPAPLPVLFVLHGTLPAPAKSTSSDSIVPLNFINETNFDGSAPDEKYAVVQPLALLHRNGDKTSPCYTWVAPDGGALMSQNVAKQAVDAAGKRIDDYAYMDQVTSAVDQLINSNPKDEHKHDNWNAFGFSQSGPFLLKYLAHRDNMFPSAAFEATAISESPDNYKPKEGNLKNVVLVNNDGDTLVMTRGWAARMAGDVIGLDEMGTADPKALEDLLIKGQKLVSQEKAVKLKPTDEKPNEEVGVRIYKADDRSTMVIDLWKAQHSVAGEGPGGGALGAKYNDHNFSRDNIARRWLQFGGKVKRDLDH
jgi:hypothetical protein